MRLLTVLAVASATLIGGGLLMWGRRLTQGPTDDTAPSQSVVTATVELRSIEETVDAPGEVRYGRASRVLAPCAGLLGRSNIREGRMVRKGDLLISFDHTELRNKKAQVIQEMKAATHALDEAKKGLTPLQKAELELAVATAGEEVSAARRESDRLARLLKHEMTSQASATEARDRLDLADKRVALAKQTLEDRARPRTEAELAKFEAAVLQTRVELRRIEKDLSFEQVTAPIDGVILEVSETLPTHRQASNLTDVTKGDPLCTIAQSHTRDVVVDVYEDSIEQVAVGNDVKIRLPDSSDHVGGKVRRVSSTGTPYGRGRRFKVYVDIAGGADRLRVGRTVNCKIIVGRAVDVLALPIEFIRCVGAREVCTVLRDGARDEIVIETGISDGDFVEIRSGLSLGQRVQRNIAREGVSRDD